MLVVVLFYIIFCIEIEAASPADPKATKETICLFNNLYNLSHDSKQFIFGHHHDNYQGQYFTDNTGLENKSDILFGTGEYPGFIEYNIQKLLNGVNFTNHILSAVCCE